MSRVYIYSIQTYLTIIWSYKYIYKCKYIYIYLIIFAKSSKYLTQTYINI